MKKKTIFIVTVIFILFACQNESLINIEDGSNDNDPFVDYVVVENYGELPIDALVKDGRRPIPISAINGTGYDDLLFYTQTGDDHEVWEKDNIWRKDAWARVEQIRKGDFTVIVKDKNGNAIPDAEVIANMYEHEWKWGTALNGNVVDSDTTAYRTRYRAAASLLYNTGVLENGHKWNYYETDTARTRSQVNAAKDLGIKYMRGHTLIWDRSFSDGWVSNNNIPQRIYDLFMADDKAGLDTQIKNHFLRITGTGLNGYRGQVYVWDVANEVLDNHAMRTKYGNGVLKDWFEWAREGAGPDTLLFINETCITGDPGRRQRTDNFRAVLDWMVDNGVDFDGIGLQSHFDDTVLAGSEFYAVLEELAGAYNKYIEITEFDRRVPGRPRDNPDPGTYNAEYEAGFTRDIIIAAFSHPKVIGFTMWGFASQGHWFENGPIFDFNWVLKESGKQYIDLVYNKWRTRESGSSGSDGSYGFRGFYGDYDITVSHDGKTKTIQSHFYKDRDNTITVTF